MKKALSLSAVLAAVALLAVVIISMSGCGPALEAGDKVYQKAMEGKGCEPTASQCDGSQLMLCNADHEWELNTDCNDYGMSRQCCTIGGNPGCYRTEECGEVSDVE